MQRTLEDEYIQAGVLEDISFINRVLWHEKELEKIWNGERATEVLPVTSERVSLIKWGILECHHRAAGKQIVLSENTKFVLRRYNI